MGEADLHAHIEDCIFCRSNGDKWLAVWPTGIDGYQVICPRCGMRGIVRTKFNDAIHDYNEIAALINGIVDSVEK